MKRIFFFSGLLFYILLNFTPLAAQDEPEENQIIHSRFSWFGAGTVLFLPENNGINSDPMPILPSPGAGFGMSLINNFRFEATVDMYFATYGYDYTLQRSVPKSWENRTAFVWGTVFGAQAAYFWDLRSFMTLRAYGGLSMDIRLVFVAPDLNVSIDPIDEIRRETKEVMKYFWSGARWLLPVIGAGMDFDINEKFRAGFDFRVWMPMYKFWTRENLPAIEGWRFGIGLRVTFL